MASVTREEFKIRSELEVVHIPTGALCSVILRMSVGISKCVPIAVRSAAEGLKDMRYLRSADCYRSKKHNAGDLGFPNERGCERATGLRGAFAARGHQVTLSS